MIDLKEFTEETEVVDIKEVVTKTEVAITLTTEVEVAIKEEKKARVSINHQEALIEVTEEVIKEEDIRDITMKISSIVRIDHFTRSPTTSSVATEEMRKRVMKLNLDRIWPRMDSKLLRAELTRPKIFQPLTTSPKVQGSPKEP